MLGIKDERGYWITWHINESVPKLEGRVITFQADCDELEFLLACMNRIDFNKQSRRLSVRRSWMGDEF